jgi:hypothetical protein
LKQKTAREKKKIRDKQEKARDDGTKQNKLYPKPNVDIEKLK